MKGDKRGNGMSVIVKGVSVPKNCYTCAKYRWSPLCPCWCGDAKASYYRTSRHPDCPFVEVPTPHGRLIDAEALANKTFYNPVSAPYITYRAFIDAPTIIEAEGSKE